ncbi:MAG: glycosyltransferase family 4 protein [Leptolyngbya sp. SIOISBB]|nr:glycosyltransferase family 4 protein [Leptolyngbya sp. SIOISBB]
MTYQSSTQFIPPAVATKNLEIIQIVPRLPPHTDGVGDYALRLGEQLCCDHSIYSHFLPFSIELDYQPLENGFPIVNLSGHTAQALMAACPSSAQGILLHYSNYPYLKSQLDAPFWLPAALKHLAKVRNIPLVVMFHELPTLDLKVFKIFNPWQIQISQRLARLADGVVTDSHRFKEVLSQWAVQPIPCVPDFSNIGEPEVVSPLYDRRRQLVIFGGRDRSRIYHNHLSSLLKTCQVLKLEKIIDIGHPLDFDPEQFGDVQWVQMEFQPSDVVSQTLLNSLAGIIDYTRFPGDLGKSSVFAAFTSHGVLPLVTAYNPSEKDGLYQHQHYLTPATLETATSLDHLQAIATAAHRWYQQHTLAKNAEVFAEQLFQRPNNFD